MIDKILKAARELAGDEDLIIAARHNDQLVGIAAVIDAAREYFQPGRSPSRCRKCDAPIVWVTTTRGRNAPLDATPIDGIDRNGVQHRIHLNHFATCPKADEVRRETDDRKSRGGGS